MLIVPRAFALTLCDRMEVNPATGEVSLVGIFNYRQFPSYPTSPQAFTVYSALHDGSGEGTMDLRVVQVSTDIEVHRWQKWWAFADRLHVLNLEIHLRNCVFPAPGRYVAALRFEDHLITDRVFALR